VSSRYIINYVGDGLEHVPQPVTGSHGFDTDAERFFERVDEPEDFPRCSDLKY
jgi:hypothetical protein